MKDDGERWDDCSRGLVPGTRKSGDQKIAGGRRECEADGNRRMSGLGVKEYNHSCRRSDRHDGPRPFRDL